MCRSVRTSISAWMFVLAVSLTVPALATEGYTLAVGTVEVDPGQSFAIPVDALWADPVMGYTLSIQFPPFPDLDSIDITIDNTLTAEIEPEYVVANVSPVTGEMVIAVLFELFPPFEVTLEVVGIPLALAEIVGTVSETAEEQNIPFDPVDGLGQPPANNIFVVDNQSLPPESMTGGLLVVRDLLDPPEYPFIRSDVNLDGLVTIADVIYHLAYTFLNGPPPLCEDAGDANDNGIADITDGIFTLNFLFVNGPQPWPPYPNPGPDYTPDDLGCDFSPF